MYRESLISKPDLKRTSQVIVAFIIIVTLVAGLIAWNTYQELSLSDASEFSISAEINYDGETIPIEITCENVYNTHLIVETTPLGCFYISEKNMSSTDLPLNNLLKAELKPMEDGIGVLQNSSEPVSSSQIQYNIEGDGKTMKVIKPPNSSGTYTLSVETTSTAENNGVQLKSAQSYYFPYYTQSQITQSKYRSAILLLNLLIWASLVLQASSLIYRIEYG